MKTCRSRSSSTGMPSKWPQNDFITSGAIEGAAASALTALRWASLVFPARTCVRALAKRASEGRTYACVSLPNDGSILVQGIRVQAYCPKCVIVWDEDILSADYESEEEFRLAVDGLLGEPPTCRCGARRVTVENIGEGTLPCPACGAPMMREGWMVKQVKVRKP